MISFRRLRFRLHSTTPPSTRVKHIPLLRLLALCSIVLATPSLRADSSGGLDEADNPGQPTATEQLAASFRQFPRLIRSGAIVIPGSSIEQPEDVGVRAHTNHLFFVPDAVADGPQGETPQSLRQVYSLPATGGSGVIAIVDAYHYPTSLKDFNVFAKAFGLPEETSSVDTRATNRVFQVVYAGGSKPETDAGWSEEMALDIEWAHAMAPSAKIVLVEAASDSNNDLYAAVDIASSLPGVVEVSMSWGGSESRNESSGDVHFQQPGVVYFAASGDTGGKVIYPGCSPYVVSAGGTTINRNTAGVFESETAWSGSGGGPSRYESRPSYQLGISNIVKSSRGVPDLAFDANPETGVSVYDSTPYEGSSGWLIFGGTSVATPSLAGIVNNAASSRHVFATSSNAELTTIYGILATASYSTDFRDITEGSAGHNRAEVGWDFVTGVGSCIGLSGK